MKVKKCIHFFYPEYKHKDFVIRLEIIIYKVYHMYNFFTIICSGYLLLFIATLCKKKHEFTFSL